MNDLMTWARSLANTGWAFLLTGRKAFGIFIRATLRWPILMASYTLLMWVSFEFWLQAHAWLPEKWRVEPASALAAQLFAQAGASACFAALTALLLGQVFRSSHKVHGVIAGICYGVLLVGAVTSAVSALWLFVPGSYKSEAMRIAAQAKRSVSQIPTRVEANLETLIKNATSFSEEIEKAAAETPTPKGY